MCHPFFDELRDPSTKLPDSRGNTGVRDLPRLFDFSRHGMFDLSPNHPTPRILKFFIPELSISPELNERLVPHHARPALLGRGIDIHNLVPMSKDEMMAKLD